MVKGEHTYLMDLEEEDFFEVGDILGRVISKLDKCKITIQSQRYTVATFVAHSIVAEREHNSDILVFMHMNKVRIYFNSIAGITLDTLQKEIIIQLKW